ncbi:MAG: class I SAM-dependent methyltransferase [Verrucomicrobiota bacterium]|nr:class I SAM-dependent methyltransferase [Verrucomicrobiota bacterium]
MTIEQTIASARERLPVYQQRIAGAPYEDKGVLYSEVLFVWAATCQEKPRRVIESGRARGVSTYLLSVCFDAADIISVEYDRNSPDVQIATRNLSSRKNVELLFGDARQLLPFLEPENDVLVIDGPKHFRALRLAFNLLANYKPLAVFIHDAFVGSPERDFLSANVPSAFYSDDPRFVKEFGFLDEPCWKLRAGIDTDEFSRPYLSYGKESSYGPTFACIPGNQSLPFAKLKLQLLIDSLRYRFKKSLQKRRS